MNTPSSEIESCVCGGESKLDRTESRLLAFVRCTVCGMKGEAECSYAEAIQSWKDKMRRLKEKT